MLTIYDIIRDMARELVITMQSKEGTIYKTDSPRHFLVKTENDQRSIEVNENGTRHGYRLPLGVVCENEIETVYIEDKD